MRKKHWITFVALVMLLSFLSHYQALGFAFIVDDWNQLWGAIYDRSLLSRYFSDHPSVAWEFIFLSKIFGFNPYYYYLVSLLLKIICSFGVGVMGYGFTKSIKVGIYSGLIFASSAMGLEVFGRISAHYAAFSIILLTVGIFFWIRAPKKKLIYLTVSAFILFFIAVVGDPGSAIMILPLIIIWEVITYYQSKFNRNLFIPVILRILLVGLLSILIFGIISQRAKYFSASLYSSNIQFATENFGSSLNNYLNSIGHLLVGWFIPIEEMLGISSPTLIGILMGYFLLIILIIQLVIFLKTKSNFSKIIFFLLSWIIFFYFPSWITQEHIVRGGLVIGVTNRYLALSSIGLIIIFAIVLEKIKNKNIAALLLSAIIFLNVFTSNRLLGSEQQYRSQKIQADLYNKIDKDVPLGFEKNSIFIYQGNNWLKIIGLEWNGVYPFVLKRGIINPDDFPLILNDINSIISKLCLDKDRYSLANVYAWDVSSGKLENTTNQFRETISRDATCDLID